MSGSGGGLFIDKKLAGIHSYVYATDGKSNSLGDVGCSTRIATTLVVSKTKELLKEIIKQAGELSNVLIKENADYCHI